MDKTILGIVLHVCTEAYGHTSAAELHCEPIARTATEEIVGLVIEKLGLGFTLELDRVSGLKP